jgi:hypothetical protein
VDISRERLLASAESVGIPSARADALWHALTVSAAPTEPVIAASAPPLASVARPERARFTGTNVAYYFGGFLVIGAMTFFMGEGWATLGQGFVLAMAVLYGVGLFALGRFLYRKPATRIPGGVLATAAVCMIPLAVYAVESLAHVWQEGNPGKYGAFYTLVHGSWIWMELATIAGSLVALRFVRFPLLTLPAAFALWFLSMDGVSVITGKDHDFSQMQWTSLWFGTAMIAVSIAIDRRTREDFAFWGYLYGTIAFFGGAGGLLWDSGPHRFLFALVSLVAIVLAIVLGRRVLMVFGTFGVAGYLGYLAFDVFSFSLLFPFALTAIGLGIVAAAIAYQRNEARIRARVLGLVPPALIAALPASRAR